MKQTVERAARDLRALLDASPVTQGMTIRTRGDHIYLGREETPGPYTDPDDPDDRLRLSLLTGSRFGLSVKRHTGRWERTPFSGSPAELVQAICATMQHLVADY